MSRHSAVALCALLAACKPTDDGKVVPDQAAADEVAKAFTADLVSPDESFRLVRLGTVDEASTVEAADPMATEEAPAEEVTPEEPGWLFLVDLAPDTFFDHPVNWLIVGESGDTTSTPASWWPLLDGVTPDSLLGSIVDHEDDVVDARVWLQAPTGIAPAFTIPRLDLAESNAYIVVQGLLPGQSLYDDASATGEGGRDFFEAYQDGVSETIYLADEEAATLLATIDAAAESHSTVTVAIIAHGSVDGIGLGGVGVSAQQVAATFSAHPNTRFNFLLGSCHGGSFVDDLAGLPNVDAVLTAVDSTQGAVPDWDVYTDGPAVTDVNAEDVGSEWFSSIYAAAYKLSATSTAFIPVREAADASGVSHSTALLCLAFDGSLGQEPSLDLDQDLDFSHFLGGHSPQRHCAVP